MRSMRTIVRVMSVSLHYCFIDGSMNIEGTWLGLVMEMHDQQIKLMLTSKLIRHIHQDLDKCQV